MGFKFNDKCPCEIHSEEQEGPMQIEVEVRVAWVLEIRRDSTQEASGRIALLPIYFDRS